MALLIRAEDVVPVTPVTPVTAPILGCRVVTLTGRAGSIRLAPADEVIRILAGATGFDLPDADVQMRDVPGEDGAREDSVRLLPRDVLLPLRLVSLTRADHLVLRDRVAAILNPRAGQVTVTVTEADGTSRQMTGRYVSGANAASGTGASGPTWTEWAAVIRVGDPAWTDTESTLIPAVRPVTSVGGFFPIIGARGVRLLPDRVLGTVTVDVGGHLPAYPSWRIDGPATSATIADQETGETLAWAGTLGTGEHLDVATWPDPYIVDGDDVSRYVELDQDPPPAFWALEPGVRTLTLALDGGDADAGSAISGSYRRRWLIQS